MNLFSEPLLTTEVKRHELKLKAGSTYVFGTGIEERSHVAVQWRRRMEDLGVKFLQVDDRTVGDTLDVIADQHHDGLRGIRLRDKASLQTLVDSWGEVCLDITGLSYVAWAPLLRAILDSPHSSRVAYVEPLDYRRNSAPARGMLYDLSEGIDGIAPLPGLASIRRRRADDSVLVALLGFEGTRLAHVINETEPSPGRVVPIVGVPGFRPEFPSQAFLGNRTSLDQDFLFRRVRFAKANCPFDLFHTLHKIQEDFSSSLLRVAPVGTKPHGLGAIMYALSRPDKAEILYDHPRRKEKRTSGEARVCIYDVSTFAESDLYRRQGTYA